MSRVLYGAHGLSEPESGGLSNHKRWGLGGTLIGQKGEGLSGEVLRGRRAF